MKRPLGPLQVPLSLDLGQSHCPGMQVKRLRIRRVSIDEVPVEFNHPADEVEGVLPPLDLEGADPHVDQVGNVVEEEEGIILEGYPVRP